MIIIQSSQRVPIGLNDTYSESICIYQIVYAISGQIIYSCVSALLRAHYIMVTVDICTIGSIVTVALAGSLVLLDSP